MRRLHRDRLVTLTRANWRVKDHAIALTAGLDDFDWGSFLERRFALVRAVPPGQIPSPIDDLQLPYCGLIVLHLPDPVDTVIGGAHTIQRCKPVLLVECTSRDGHRGDPGPILARLGACELYRAGPDRIYGWDR